MGKRQSRQPGCCGCLLIIVLILLAIGGWQAVGDFISLLSYTFLVVVIAATAAVLGFAHSIRKLSEEYRRRSGTNYQQHNAAPSAAMSEHRYYTVLGVDEQADFAAIKKAYRQLSMQYHPDKVAHLGAEFKRVAEEKMKDINAAYDYFRRKFERG